MGGLLRFGPQSVPSGPGAGSARAGCGALGARPSPSASHLQATAVPPVTHGREVGPLCQSNHRPVHGSVTSSVTVGRSHP